MNQTLDRLCADRERTITEIEQLKRANLDEDCRARLAAARQHLDDVNAAEARLLAEQDS